MNSNPCTSGHRIGLNGRGDMSTLSYHFPEFAIRAVRARAPVATLSAPPFPLSAGRATVLRTTRLTPELRRHPVSPTARTDSFNTEKRQDEDRAQSGSLGSSARSPDVTMTHDQKRARLETLLRQNDLSLARVSVAIGRNKTYLQQYLRRGMPALLAFQDPDRPWYPSRLPRTTPPDSLGRRIRTLGLLTWHPSSTHRRTAGSFTWHRDPTPIVRSRSSCA